MPATMSERAAAREQRRRSRLGGSVVIVVGFGAALGYKVGAAAAIGGSLGLVLFVLAVGWAAVLSGRGRESARRSAGQPPSYGAQLPVWAARAAGGNTPPRYRDETELPGRLRVLPDGLVWQPNATLSKQGIRPIEWRRADLAACDFQALSGVFPLGYLRLRTRQGSDVDLWVRDPGDLSARLAAVSGTGGVPRPHWQ